MTILLFWCLIPYNVYNGTRNFVFWLQKKQLPSVDKEKGASLILRTTSAVIKKIHELFIIRPVTNTYFTIRIFDHKTIRIQIFEYLKLGQKHAKKTARRHSLKLVTALSHWDSSSSRSCTSMQLYMQYMLSLAWNYIINWQKYHPFMILVFEICSVLLISS